MNIDYIRNMSDVELKRFLNRKDRITLYVFKYENRKLCNLCKDCYIELLDYLGVCDVD